MRMLIISLLFVVNVFAQDKTLTYSKYGEPFMVQGEMWYSNNVHEIKLSPEGTFEFWIRPVPRNCFFWRNIKGAWSRKNDTLYFTDKYQIYQRDVTANHHKNRKQSFDISFRTDQSKILNHKKVTVTYIYDFNAQLHDVERDFTISEDDKLEIPFSDIPAYSQLVSIQIDYLLNDSSKRTYYFTTNSSATFRQHDIPNIINVVFIERPENEMIYRTTKGVMRDGKLYIVSTEKSVGKLKDDNHELKFEEGYVLTPCYP